MGFEDYSVLMRPKGKAAATSVDKVATISKVVNEVRAEWPELQYDDAALELVSYRPTSNEVFLVNESSLGLFQVRIAYSFFNSSDSYLEFDLRFAYCNPRTVYIPFCDFIEWSMQKYKLNCVIMRDLAPNFVFDGKDIIEDTQNVRPTLLPSMDYNRKLWQIDVGTSEEAILRPEEALARFVLHL